MNLQTTQTYYIKTTSKDVQKSMQKLEAEIERLRASVLPATTQEVEQPKFVN